MMVLKLFLSLILAGNTAVAANLDLPSERRVPIRATPAVCETLIQPPNPLDDSVAIPFGEPKNFEAAIENAIAEYGRERLRDHTIFVTGIGMIDEKDSEERFAEILKSHGLDRLGVRVRIMSVPSNLVRPGSASLPRAVFERVRYFLPSLKRDYQAPQLGEIYSNWQSVLVIETATAAAVILNMSKIDAALVLLAHATVLFNYSVFAKMLNNYLRRRGGASKVDQASEAFLRQALPAVPFIVEFNVFSRSSEIARNLKTLGPQKVAELFPPEFAHTLATQGPTLFWQTVFYTLVVTGVYGKWVDSQIGEQNTADARTLRAYLQIPVLVADSILMLLTSHDRTPVLFSSHGINFSAGHAGLIALTAASLAFFKKYPDFLNGVLDRYQRQRAASRAESFTKGAAN